MASDEVPRVVIGVEHGDHISISVLGRKHGEASDYWDGNWLVTPVVVVSGGMRADVGAALRAEEFSAFRRGLVEVDRTLTGEAILQSMESWLTLRVAIKPSGRLSVEGRVTDWPRSNTELTFRFDSLDVTYLPPVLDALAELEAAYPVLGTP